MVLTLPNHLRQVAELYRRGWSRFELSGLTGRNLLRVMAGAERVAKDLQAAVRTARQPGEPSGQCPDKSNENSATLR